MHPEHKHHHMKATSNSWPRQALAVVLCGLLAPASLAAGQSYPAPENVGAIIGVKPGATVDNQPVQKTASLERNAAVRTNRSGRMRIRLRGGEVLTLGGATVLQVANSNPVAQTAVVKLQSGQVRSEIGRFHRGEAAYDVITPQARITSHGDSDFYLDVTSTHTRVIVYSGIVLARPLHGPSTAPVDVAAGQTVVVNPGKVSRLELTADDEVQDSLWETSFPTDSLTESNRTSAGHKKLYIILGVAGAAVSGIALATRGSRKSSTSAPASVPASVPTIPPQ